MTDASAPASPTQRNSDASALADVLRRLETSSLHFRSRLADRLLVLSDAFAEDYPARPLSALAIGAFVDFLEADPALEYPDLTATPEGGLYAEWSNDHGRSFAIEFLASGKSRRLNTGAILVEALANSPLKDVPIKRLSTKSPVPDVDR